DDVFTADQQPVHQLHVDPQTLQTHARVELVGQQILPLRQSVGLAIENTNAVDGTHASHEVAVLGSSAVDQFLIACIELPMQGQAQQQVTKYGYQGYPGQRGAVDKHQQQGTSHHQGIDTGFHNA